MTQGSTENNPLIGQWLNDEDEDQYVGRLLYDYLPNGEIWVHVYKTKDDTDEMDYHKVGEYSISEDILKIRWIYDPDVPMNYRITTIEPEQIICIPFDKHERKLTYFKPQ